MPNLANVVSLTLVILLASRLPAQTERPLPLTPNLLTDGAPDLAKVEQAAKGAGSKPVREADDFIAFWRIHARKEVLGTLARSMRVWEKDAATIASNRRQMQVHLDLGEAARAADLRVSIAAQEERLAELRRKNLTANALARGASNALLARCFVDLATTPNRRPRRNSYDGPKVQNGEYRALAFEQLKDRIVEHLAKEPVQDGVRRVAMDLHACLQGITEALYRGDVADAQKHCDAVTAWVLDPTASLPARPPAKAQ